MTTKQSDFYNRLAATLQDGLEQFGFLFLAQTVLECLGSIALDQKE